MKNTAFLSTIHARWNNKGEILQLGNEFCRKDLHESQTIQKTEWFDHQIDYRNNNKELPFVVETTQEENKLR